LIFFHGFLGDMMDDYYDHLRFGRNYMRRMEEVIEPEEHAHYIAETMNMTAKYPDGEERVLLDIPIGISIGRIFTSLTRRSFSPRVPY